MPQVDLETLVSACAGGGGSADNKISCETLAAHADDDYKSDPDLPEKINSDYLPESFWLSKDAEFDWFDRNAYYVRSESTKGNSAYLNSNLIQNTDSHSNSSSQRFSGTLRRSKAAVIGLPKPQKFMDSKNRRNCKTAKPRLFPKRSGSGSVGGKSNSQVIEPSSPNVSCMGRVRSKRDRTRRFRSRQRSKSSEPAPPVKPPKPARRKRDVLFSTFRSIFRSGKRSELASSHNAQSGRSDSTSSRRSSVAMSRDIRERLPAVDIDEHFTESSLPRRSVAESEPPAIGLGGMKRFVSGRRPDLGQ